MTDNPAQANGLDENPDCELDARALKLARETLTGDIRDTILNDMRDRKTGGLPWTLRGEADQADIIDRVTRLSESIVARAVGIIAAGGRKTIHAKLNKITIKDGIKAEIELNKTDEQCHTLFDSQGAMVMIVIADPEPFTAERAPVPITKPPEPQQEMPFDKNGDAPSSEPRV